MFKVRERSYVYHIEEIERVKYRVERFLLMPKHGEWLRREAFVRQAYASTMIENPSISEEELFKAQAELTVTRPDVQNYARALEFVDFVSAQKDLVLDELVIKQIHWLLMKGVHDSQFLPGEYRRATNWIEDNGAKVYEPPFQTDVPILMREFVETIRSSKLHPIIVAGVAHLHLVAIHPFVDGNGRTARLLATLLLQGAGWGFRNLLSLDSFYQRRRGHYIDAIVKTLGPKYPVDYDADRWMEFFCQSVLNQAHTLESRLTDWQMTVDAIRNEVRSLGLRERQIEGMIYAIHKGRITRKDYLEIASVSPVTGTRDLADLVEKGLLTPHGERRNRIYRLSPSIVAETSGAPREGVQPKLIS